MQFCITHDKCKLNVYLNNFLKKLIFLSKLQYIFLRFRAQLLLGILSSINTNRNSLETLKLEELRFCRLQSYSYRFLLRAIFLSLRLTTARGSKRYICFMSAKWYMIQLEIWICTGHHTYNFTIVKRINNNRIYINNFSHFNIV